MKPSQHEISNRFTYHAPIGNQPDRYHAIREKARELALLLNDLCPASRELALAYTELESAIMWANASIARNENERNCRVTVPCCGRDTDKDGNCDIHSAPGVLRPLIPTISK